MLTSLIRATNNIHFWKDELIRKNEPVLSILWRDKFQVEFEFCVYQHFKYICIVLINGALSENYNDILLKGNFKKKLEPIYTITKN